MMSVETMRSVNPKTVDRSTLSSGTASGLSLRVRRMSGCGILSGRSETRIAIWTGKTVVKISFSKTDTTLEDCLEHYLRGL